MRPGLRTTKAALIPSWEREETTMFSAVAARLNYLSKTGATLRSPP